MQPPSVENDWRAHCNRALAQLRCDHPRWDPQSHAADAFELTLKAWRWAHGTMRPDDLVDPASAVDGVIELAKLGIMAPISELSHIKKRPSRDSRVKEA